MNWQTATDSRYSAISPKRLTEVFLCFVGLVVASPFLIVLPILIKATSPGPILFTSTRIGRRGKVFRLLKFRSMYVNAPRLATADNVTLVTVNDSRLTRIGPFLRLGFDELPQLFNVLAGDMALIGPRPDEPEDLAGYDTTAMKRISVLPGITGLGAICGSRNLSARERYLLDAYYVDNLSFRLDAWIFIMTPAYILGYRSPGKELLKAILQADVTR